MSIEIRKIYPRIDFFNTFVNIFSKIDQKRIIEDNVRKNDKLIFYYLNSYSFYLLHTNVKFRNAFNFADFIIPDGMSIVWGIKMSVHKKISKVTINHSFFEYMIELIQKYNASVYFLGSTEIISKTAIDNLIHNHPELKVAGYQQGYFNHNEDSDRIIQSINNAKPNILFVGMGMPQSEIWIHDNYSKFNNYLIITCGNLIDIIAGKSKLAPKFLYSSGLEWIYRIINEPARLSPRYLVANIFYVRKLIKHLLLK